MENILRFLNEEINLKHKQVLIHVMCHFRAR